ncbi:DNA primase large subunit [Plakobranchus ocellatus]|uniref:DNA primase large subunit n=1 Tax=Plakobranchus ocellatus TaxID=259542 RepID=A0AAV3ZZ22_9GAST|nr:DNA primase large subunit [Plakobranchus ocellatus]
MVFYLLPPTGNVPYQKLEEYTLKRLQFLLRLVCCASHKEVQETLQDASTVHQSDCLISGSSKDLISHHMLRLALCEDKDTKTFLSSSELALFKLRVGEMNVKEWECFLRRTTKDLSLLLKSFPPAVNSFLSDLDFLLGILKQECGTWHHTSEKICSLSGQSLHLPFQLALSLVARREVFLTKGLASVPLAKLPEILSEMFQRNMELAMLRARAERVLTQRDPRIRRLCAVVKRVYRLETKASYHISPCLPPLKLSTLWSQAEYFPPCMSNLMNSLRQRHRLKHQDRIQLTLFLKDLGLSLHEALLLWKQEYSKPPAPPVDPSKHGWHGNERRYIYNIRHLYGLEGGKINYRCHSCLSIQGRSLSYMDCGGCPFSVFDEAQTRESLLQLGLDRDTASQVLLLARDKHPGAACASYMRARLKHIEHDRKLNNLRDSVKTNGADLTEETQLGKSTNLCNNRPRTLCRTSVNVCERSSVCPNREKITYGKTSENTLPLHIAKQKSEDCVLNCTDGNILPQGELTCRRLFKRRSRKQAVSELVKRVCWSEQGSSLRINNTLSCGNVIEENSDDSSISNYGIVSHNKAEKNKSVEDTSISNGVIFSCHKAENDKGVEDTSISNGVIVLCDEIENDKSIDCTSYSNGVIFSCDKAENDKSVEDSSISNGVIFSCDNAENDKGVEDISTAKNGNFDKSLELVITKPSDYYRSYIMLLNSLKTSDPKKPSS